MESMTELSVNLFTEAAPSMDLIRMAADFVNTNEANRVHFSEQVEANKDSGNPLGMGISFYLLGRYNDSLDRLQIAADCREKFLYQAYSLRNVGRFHEAIECLQKAVDHQADILAVAMEKVETFRQARQFEAAENELRQNSNYENISAEYHYQWGRLQEAQGFYDEVMANYEKALELAPSHQKALFFLALRCDYSGNEDRAIHYYQQIAGRSRVHVNALLNLAVLYEDSGDFEKASYYVSKVLDAYPNHQRAILFKKDIDSSKTMFFDEEKERRLSKKHQILETPITDFELSVRSRNCLKKMNIRTLGDLLRTTETDLLSYKNFGETSLREIKAILDSKSLSLGMVLEDAQFARPEPPSPENDEADDGMLGHSVDELQLSVRARKCLQKLNIRTIGDITRTTEAELLGCKNFGVTSLNDINKALAGLGLSLRKLD